MHGQQNIKKQIIKCIINFLPPHNLLNTLS